ncbi:TetR/AcrR family transcriptional regulator [Cryobacterium sp. CG_9.6]|uniref:TetR/AcrR family transcriptional regulator n=1 Tax=Cryobacterium sp. CG_9.6 TaxID=2760710 RepID=UPI002476B50D|nr:TetR/AcrR family transcriptional regulator [Cryobacterium sp. CG_9.6]MDH6236975.1 AcrR family transcriptional regulator [Cryobacterium sp. CG_9.6]
MTVANGFHIQEPEARLFTHDPRAERTRQLIFTATRALMADPTASVSVADIVRMGGISRSSFYAHFASLDDVAAELLRVQFAEISVGDIDLPDDSDDAIEGRGRARRGYTRLVGHMLENFPLYSTVAELPLTRSAFDQIVDAYASRMLESIFEGEDVPPQVDAELVTTYVAGGALTLISAWMRGHIDVSDDELVDQLVTLLPEWLMAPPAPSP